MNRFNARIALRYQPQLEESDEFGNPLESWVDRVASVPAEKETVKGSLRDIANRKQNILYFKFTVWSSSVTRAIESTDRLIDLTNGNRIHQVTNVYETDDRRKVIIQTESADNQSIYQ